MPQDVAPKLTPKTASAASGATFPVPSPPQQPVFSPAVPPPSGGSSGAAAEPGGGSHDPFAHREDRDSDDDSGGEGAWDVGKLEEQRNREDGDSAAASALDFADSFLRDDMYDERGLTASPRNEMQRPGAESDVSMLSNPSPSGSRDGAEQLMEVKEVAASGGGAETERAESVDGATSDLADLFSLRLQIATKKGEIKNIEGKLGALEEADTHKYFRKGRLVVGGMVVPLRVRKMSPEERDLDCRRMELKGDVCELHMLISTSLTRDVPTIAATAAKLEDADAGMRMAAIEMLGMLLCPEPSDDDVARRHFAIGCLSDSSDEESEEPPSLADDPVAVDAIAAIAARLEDADPRVRTVALATLSELSRSLLERQKVSMAEALRPYAAAITATEERHLCLLLDRLPPAHVVRPTETVQRPSNRKRPLHHTLTHTDMIAPTLCQLCPHTFSDARHVPLRHRRASASSSPSTPSGGTPPRRWSPSSATSSPSSTGLAPRTTSSWIWVRTSPRWRWRCRTRRMA